MYKDSSHILNIPNQNIETQRIKVIHIYKDFDIYNGLIETFLLMARMFDSNKIDFKVCVFNYKGSSFGEKFRKLGGKLDSLDAAWEDNPAIIYKLYKYLKREKPHIVQTYILKPNLFGRIAAMLARVPVIISTELTLKNQAPTILRRFRDLFFHPINAVLNKSSDAVICASEAIKRQWDKKGMNGKVKVIYPPFDITKKSGNKEGSEKKDGNWVIGTVGRLSEEKRHIDLLEAFSNIIKVFPEARLLIVGDGYMRNQIEEKIKDLNVCNKVELTGFQENVFEYLEKMDIFVLASRTEGSPLSIFEAMSASLPVIATRVGGIPEVVLNNETGLLINAQKVSELTDAVIRLLSSPEKMYMMGQQGRDRVLNHFNPNDFISRHEEMYKTLLFNKLHYSSA